MPVYRLGPDLVFPPAELAEANGLLAVGGDLSSERLLLAYSMGIFPWFNEGDPILWWSPDPRCVLFPGEVHVSRSLRKVLRRAGFQVSFDQDFDGVIRACAQVRCERGEETWITAEMIQAYRVLFRLGYAHSVEVWKQGELVGGLYGVALGRFFFGESMFSRCSNASKVALVNLCYSLRQAGYLLIDCQLPNPHLYSLGARDLARSRFLSLLSQAGLRPSVTPDPGAFPLIPAQIHAA
ncbi:MAG: leucyl/phenylalanyl-tRNA--protein transferase [Deltaproteobacteria bacterium]|nr:MAG: leucyl/phenylalanyl-tRNA--protein transferase [Deltaproteobacteria bacterium]